MTRSQTLVDQIQTWYDAERYRREHWEGSFEEYLELVRSNPLVARSAFQRLYDMILAYGTEEYTENRQKVIHYKFFDDPIDSGRDAVYGLDHALMDLVSAFQSAARRYGTERRVLLLHGPVGSSKSTIARLLKKGLEHYSHTDAGALYSLRWTLDNGQIVDCPMHEEALHLIPPDYRARLEDEINRDSHLPYRIEIEGDLCPFCRYIYRDLMDKLQGDWTKVMQHIRVRRLILSEKDRIGIGTFQPKDEKNQDSTELTGDINYRKIAEYGSDSDPRAFSFDGEFNIANRGIIEFIEVLKLDVAFLYDLLTASQEHKIKPKKFAQTDIDEVILGHSVTGSTPIPYRYQGAVGWTTLAGLHERFATDTRGLEVLAYDFDDQTARWTTVKSVFRHRFTGDMLTTSQKWGAVETTPNHSIYSRDGQPFYPEERREVMALRRFDAAWTPPSGAARLDAVDVVADVPGFVREDALAVAGVGPMLSGVQAGWARLDLPRHATQVQAVYHPLWDADALKDLITVLVWYATEGHVNGRNGGIVISQANRDELERVRAAYARVTTGKGSIDAGAKTDSAWRLYLGSQAIATLVKHHCGELSVNKRLPDFLFGLPTEFLAHAFDELMRTDGSRRLSSDLEKWASTAYRERYFEFKTLSPVLAAQVGTLATLLNYDYSVYRHERPGKAPAYRIRFVSSSGKRGGRRTSFEARLVARTVADEWVYDIECQGLHNFVCGVGNIVAHNTNEPEYRKLQNNEYMEALRDRTVKVDVPYITRLRDEVRIYEKDFNPTRIQGRHIAPHTIEMAAMWAILTRLEPPKHAGLTLLQKLKLYDGKSIPGFTEDSVRELKAEARREGMEGISPRYVQDKLSNALVSESSKGCLNPFIVMRELEEGLRHHSLITDERQRQHYRELIAVIRQEYDEMVKNEVQRAITSDEEAIKRLASNYIDNVKAYTLRERVRNPYTGQDEEPDERLMRSIEEKIDIPANRKDDFRREIMNYIGALAIEGKRFAYDSNERLRRALELKLFEDQKDSIKLTSLVSSVVDPDTQAKIDVVKTRMIKNFGYCEVCASDVLTYVASIFARGDVRNRN